MTPAHEGVLFTKTGDSYRKPQVVHLDSTPGLDVTGVSKWSLDPLTGELVLVEILPEIVLGTSEVVEETRDE